MSDTGKPVHEQIEEVLKKPKSLETLIAECLDEGYKVAFDPSPLVPTRFDMIVCKNKTCSVVSLDRKEGFNLEAEMDNLKSELRKHFAGERTQDGNPG